MTVTVITVKLIVKTQIRRKSVEASNTNRRK